MKITSCLVVPLFTAIAVRGNDRVDQVSEALQSSSSHACSNVANDRCCCIARRLDSPMNSIDRTWVHPFLKGMSFS